MSEKDKPVPVEISFWKKKNNTNVSDQNVVSDQNTNLEENNTSPKTTNLVTSIDLLVNDTKPKVIASLQEEWENKVAEENIVIPYVPKCLIPMSAVWNEEQQNKLLSYIKSFDVSWLTSENIDEIWLEEWKKLTDWLKEIAWNISKANSPILYELAEIFIKWKEWINLEAIEEKIKKAQKEPSVIWKFINKLNKKTPAQALMEAISEIDKEIRPQAHTLSENMDKIQAQHGNKIRETKEANRILIETWNEFLSNVPVFANITHFLYWITEKARIELEKLEKKAGTTLSPQDRHIAKEYSKVVELLESRALALNTQYHDIEPTLDIISEIVSGNNMAISESISTFFTTFTQLLKNIIVFHGARTWLELHAWNERMNEVVKELRWKNSGLVNQLAISSTKSAWKNRYNEALAVLKQVEDQAKLAIDLKKAKETRSTKFAQTEILLRQIVEKIEGKIS